MITDNAAGANALRETSLTWSRGRLVHVDTCPGCGAANRSSQTFTRGDDSGLMPDLWHVHRCARCGSVYLDPRPDGTSLPAAYTDYLTHEVAEREPVFTSNAAEWALVRGYLEWRFGFRSELRVWPKGRWLFRLFEPWRLKLDRFGRHLTRSRFPNAGRLLDVGCGAGDFLLLADAMGWSATGCDTDEEVIAICRSRGLDVRPGIEECLEAQSESFDAVTLNQVIEHVPEPQELVSRCRQLLRPGGMLWMGLPNPRAIGATAFGPSWAGLHPPYHLCLPTQAVLHRWLREAGFEGATFMRCGSHARANWQRSGEIEAHLGTMRRSVLSSHAGRLFANTLNVLTPTWGEETVVIAWKPGPV